MMQQVSPDARSARASHRGGFLMIIDVRPLRPEPRPDSSSRSSDSLRDATPFPDDPGVLREALEIGGIGSWSWNTETDNFTADAVARKLWCLPEEGALTIEVVRAVIHP